MIGDFCLIVSLWIEGVVTDNLGGVAAIAPGSMVVGFNFFCKKLTSVLNFFEVTKAPTLLSVDCANSVPQTRSLLNTAHHIIPYSL